VVEYLHSIRVFAKSAGLLCRYTNEAAPFVEATERRGPRGAGELWASLLDDERGAVGEIIKEYRRNDLAPARWRDV
jgi:hypothetical protein